MSPANFIKNSDLDREAVAKALREWLGAILPLTKLDLRADVQVSGQAKGAAQSSTQYEKPDVVVLLSGRDQGILLERNAEVLLALEYLAVRSLRIDPPFFDRVRFDSGDWRATRISELQMAARVAADRVRETRQPFRFNPMTARERRIVHLALQDVQGIRTSSEGAGDERQVVIFPAEPAK